MLCYSSKLQFTKQSNNHNRNSGTQEIILLSEEPAETVSLSEPEHMEGSAAASVEERDRKKPMHFIKMTRQIIHLRLHLKIHMR